MRKKTVLIILAILAFGLIGTSISTLHEEDEFIASDGGPMGIRKVSYGFPFGWHGYSLEEVSMPGASTPKYWFSLESFLLDTALWLTISSLACSAAVKLGNTLRKTRAKILSAKNTVMMYFFASLFFSLVGIWLCSVTQTLGILPPSTSIVVHPYLDLGLRLVAIGMVLVAATFYQSLAGKRRTSQKPKIGIGTL